MTVINMMVQPRARTGFIISDGAHTDPDGVVTELSPKVIVGTKRLPFAIAVTGNVAPLLIAMILGEESPLTLKQLVKRLPIAMRKAVAAASDARSIPEDAIGLALVGVVWDFAKNRAQGFSIASRDGLIRHGMEPYLWYDTDSSVTIVSGDDVASFIGRFNLADPASFNPETDGLELVRVQRELLLETTVPGCALAYRIGGEIDLTEVTKNGVKTWKIHDFHDKVGERILPDNEFILEFGELSQQRQSKASYLTN